MAFFINTKSMTKFFHLFALIFLSFSCYAQFELLQDSRVPGAPLQVSNSVEYSGSPYYLNEWSKGIVTFANGQQVKDVDLRYNALEDHLEFQKDGNAFILDPSKISGFEVRISGTNHRFVNGLNVSGFSTAAFFRVIYQGKLSVLVKHTKYFANSPSASYGSSMYREIQSKDMTMILLSDGTMVPFKKTKKNLKDIFPTNFESIDQYMKKEGISLKEDSDLEKLFAIIDSLENQTK